MAETPRKTGKKHRKYGRGLKKPSHTRYNNERRWEKNKARKAARVKKELERKDARKARKDSRG